MKVIKYAIWVLCLVGLLAVGTGCEQEGPAEKAGKQIDQTIEEAGDAIEDAGDKIEETTDN